MIPLDKLATIIFKTFSSHLIKFTKQHTKHRLLFLRGPFIWVGNQLHIFEHRVNKRFTDSVKKLKEDQYIKKLSSDKAFDNGFNFMLEVVLLYGIIIAISIHEVNKSSADKQADKEKIDDIKANISACQQSLSITKQLWNDIAGIQSKLQENSLMLKAYQKENTEYLNKSDEDSVQHFKELDKDIQELRITMQNKFNKNNAVKEEHKEINKAKDF